MELINLTNKGSFFIGKYNIISQHPDVLSPREKAIIVPAFLPVFIQLWKAIEEVTGYRWKSTSYLRRSPSHSKGQAFDLAPDWADQSSPLYAVSKGSDPVLYKRIPLIVSLQRLVDDPRFFHPKVSLGIFIESDHLHIQILKRTPRSTNISIVKWGARKPIYSDTDARMLLPDIKGRVIST